VIRRPMGRNNKRVCRLPAAHYNFGNGLIPCRFPFDFLDLGRGLCPGTANSWATAEAGHCLRAIIMAIAAAHRLKVMHGHADLY
jgi:hypothetical protein